MKDFCENYIKSYEGLNKWVKFFINFLWAVPTNLYRVAKSVKKNDLLGTIVGVIMLIACGCWVIAIIDFVTIALYNKVYWFDFNELKLFADGGDAVIGDSKEEEKKEEGNPDKID